MKNPTDSFALPRKLIEQRYSSGGFLNEIIHLLGSENFESFGADLKCQMHATREDQYFYSMLKDRFDIRRLRTGIVACASYVPLPRLRAFGPDFTVFKSYNAASDGNFDISQDIAVISAVSSSLTGASFFDSL